MIEYKVVKNEGIWIDDAASIIITRILAHIVRENGFSVLAFNICGDHVHLLLEASADKVSDIVKVMKSASTYRYKQEMNMPPSETYHLWQQKFNRWLIASDEQFYNTMVYIIHNRTKHRLPGIPELNPIIENMITAKEIYKVVEKQKIIMIDYQLDVSAQEIHGLTHEAIRVMEGKNA